MIQRLIVGVLFIVFAALQIRYTAMTFEVFSHPLAETSLGSLDLQKLTFDTPSPQASAAGAKKGDRVLAEDGRPIASRIELARIFNAHKPGEKTTLTLRRGAAPPFDIAFAIEQHAPRKAFWWVFPLALNIVTPWSCILLGFLVAFRRPNDPVTWSLLFFLVCVSQFLRSYEGFLSWDAPLSWLAFFLGSFSSYGIGIGWMWFAIQFPDPKSPWRVWPWARWVPGIPYGVIGVLDSVWVASVAHDAKALAWLTPVNAMPTWIDLSVVTIMIGLGFANFAFKLRHETNPSTRRRLRWVVLGLIGGVFPVLSLMLITVGLGKQFNDVPIFILGPCILSPFLIPLTIAYAVLVNRLFDVGVFVRQGLLASKTVGGIRVIFLAGLVYLAISLETQPGTPGPVRIAELMACVAGIVATRRGADRLRKWVDRRFFQEAVNSEHLLVELSGEVRGIREPETLLRTVTDRIARAMHVSRVVALMPNSASFIPAYALAGCDAPAVGFDDPVVAELKSSRRPVPRSDELLVPISTGADLQGILSLGPKRSEEPYSGRDLALLESVASQTAMALENSRLTATVAEEAAHRERITSELEIARTVQERLFPKTAPKVDGLDLAGCCRPAQTVGGDYYDFFTTPSGATGFAIGDIAGKGVPAALLMASLQASLRGLTLAGISDLADLMEKLNILMYEASPANRFATFFCCLYDPATRRLRYSSAGHNPALLRRANATSPVWLKTRGPALGLRLKSVYEQAEVTLERGDCLVLYTDGVTEARNGAGEEFEESRLADTVLRTGPGTAHQVLDSIMGATIAFAGSATQHDDITLIVAVCGTPKMFTGAVTAAF
jgi:sigma-B regulation protein RsbU (phosphoserine phosphatase)